MNEGLMQLTCGGILAVLIVREVMSFLKSRNGKNGSNQRMEKMVAALLQQTNDLHDWHKPDGRGEQTWKNSQMIDTLQEMKTVVQNNTQAFERLRSVMERREYSGRADGGGV